MPWIVLSPFSPEIAFCHRSDDGDPLPERPEEAAALAAQAVPARRREFLLGRAAAHAAIATVSGASEQPILRGPRGEPLWPEGLVGTITHTRGVALAAVARRQDSAGLGLDLERCDRKVTQEVERLVASPAERIWIAAAEPALRLKRLFCAKEALFKALYPLAGVYLGFKDAELGWEGEGFSARLVKAAAPAWPSGSRLQVGCRLDGDHLLCWVQLPP